ncbi:hypothetical protein B0H67DRAFT_14182 [Lasiosphaeris hirsuta]|uniref:Uncharacterized protein n=1 Tax=Lasiosphaeris hirsuta TaxID=260670 RepID=A0AA40B944_9PEZI|nr:hypothetical protein B0H67DRAFT_14182 [Lasiosphaeris hirsuta]
MIHEVQHAASQLLTSANNLQSHNPPAPHEATAMNSYKTKVQPRNRFSIYQRLHGCSYKRKFSGSTDKHLSSPWRHAPEARLHMLHALQPKKKKKKKKKCGEYLEPSKAKGGKGWDGSWVFCSLSGNAAFLALSVSNLSGRHRKPTWVCKWQDEAVPAPRGWRSTCGNTSNSRQEKVDLFHMPKHLLGRLLAQNRNTQTV